MVKPIFTLLTLCLIQLATATYNVSVSHHLFAKDIFRVLAENRTSENLVFSPASILNGLTLLYTAAEGRTAHQLRRCLQLGYVNKTIMAERYGVFLKQQFKRTADGPLLKMANRVYVNKKYTLAPQFNEIATKYFDSEAELLDFNNSSMAVTHINTWVAGQTENKIQNLLAADAVGLGTTAVLVNAIYFEGKWVKEFKIFPERQDFIINAEETTSVDMIYKQDKVNYTYSDWLNATAISLPYANSDLSMLIILPNKLDGLKQLESKLVNWRSDFIELQNKMVPTRLKVVLPKFRIDFDVELHEPLRQLGIHSIFADDADLSGLFANGTQLKVSKVQHKAFIDVNESGTEAAAATAAIILNRSAELFFRADHPFVFAILNRDAVLFMGHVVRPQS